jgi:hypothetical protein
MKKSILVAAVVALASTAVFAEEMVENPQYAAWAKFKVGSSLKTQTVTVMTVQGNEMTNKVTTTSVLKEVTAAKAVLEVTTVMVVNGQETAMPAQKVDVPAKIKKGPTTEHPPGYKTTKLGEGDEEVAVGEKKYKCHWIKTKVTGPQIESTTTVWSCPDVPGGTVKTISDTVKPMKTKATIIALEVKVAS